MPIRLLPIVFAVLCCTAYCTLAPACLRPSPNKRAIQWSTAIVHAKLRTVAARGAGGEQYGMEVVDVLEGPLKPGETVNAKHTIPSGNRDQCAGVLTNDDAGKTFLFLLRQGAHDGDWQVVTDQAIDPADPTDAEAFKQLLAETRKAEAALTDDQVKAQALALANAEDDTEAQQAEDTLLDMGPKAVPAIRSVLESSTPIGKHRLEKIIKDVTPPTDQSKTPSP
ncbi:MAG TPA: hypothetical protein VLI90_19525 [Tepidisphaeraceae bacterium]|nr:hypothetical protein [Tepidisphaeraceae bacterium]